MRPELTLNEKGSGQSHTNESTRKAGKAIKAPFKLSLKTGVATPEWLDKMGRVVSVLLGQFSEVPVLSSTEAADISQVSYSTEADISLLMSLALIDAVKLAKYATGLDFEVRHEASLFSQRPDHLVVVDLLTDAPLVAVEDRSHGAKPRVLRNWIA
jgi:hypothetical protein